jgi:hypothetical protein
MAIETHVYNGAWRKAQEIFVYNGSWRSCITVHVYDGGAWRQVFAAPVVTLSGGTFSTTTSSTAISGIRVNADGTVDKLTGASYSQVSASTDWIIPNSAAYYGYEVRVTNVSWASAATGFDAEAAAEDTWISMDSNREWKIIDSTSGGAGTKDVTFDVEIKDSGGTTQASTSYRLYAERT